MANGNVAFREDALTVTLSANDDTTQVMHLGGVLALVKGLLVWKAGNSLTTVSSQDVLGCSVESAIDYSAMELGQSAAYRARNGLKQAE